METNSALYKRAFEDYLRKGAPIEFSLKQTQSRTTTHHIWRTRPDGKACPNHAANEGGIFARDDSPPTGHPGEDYGCRYRANSA